MLRHRPGQRDRVAAVVAHHALRLPGGAGGVEDVERVGGRDRDAARPASARGGQLVPVEPRRRDAVVGCAGDLLAILTITVRRRVLGQLDRLVEQRLVLDDAAGLDAAGRRDDHLRAWRRRSAPRARLAAKPPNTTECTAPIRAHASIAIDGLGDHRHVDDHPVARPDAERRSTPANVATSSRSSA